MGVRYTTRKAVKAALDFKLTARADAQVDDAIEAASRIIEGRLRRKFYPQVDTRYFEWPNQQRGRPHRLWLDENELISVTTLTAGGTVIAASDYFLEPANSGPPYRSIEIDLSSGASFAAGDTRQRAIEITGVFGHSADTVPAGALNEALDASETDVDITDSAVIGVGDILQVDSERMIVTDPGPYIDTTLNTASSMDALASDDVVDTSSGSFFKLGEVLMVNSEKMLIVDIAGNNLIVKRAWDGSVLAAHSTTQDILLPRRITVTRGALGTTAATHDTMTAMTKHAPPGLIVSLCKAEAINILQQDQAAWGRTVGSGDNEREMAGKGLESLWEQARAAYGRRLRVGST